MPESKKPDAAQKELKTPEAERYTDEAKPTEIGGKKEGREPTRYGDWENKGIASDF